MSDTDTTAKPSFGYSVEVDGHRNMVQRATDLGGGILIEVTCGSRTIRHVLSPALAASWGRSLLALAEDNAERRRVWNEAIEAGLPPQSRG